MLWTLKGGAGCSVVAALVAVERARHRGPTLLVDLADDQRAVLAVAPSTGPTLADLARLGPQVDPQVVVDIADEVAPNLWVVAAGDPAVSVDAAIAMLSRFDGEVVVDAGCLRSGAHPWAAALRAFAADQGGSVLVVRPCYLALRHHVDAEQAPSGVILVRERGRALDTGDVARAVGAPVWTVLDVDPAVARAVDAGVLLRSARRLVDLRRLAAR